MLTPQHAIGAAAAQLKIIITALEDREQQARGHASHVPIPTDRDLKRIAELALSHLGGCP